MKVRFFGLCRMVNCEACEGGPSRCWLEVPYPGHNFNTLYECEDCGAVFTILELNPSVTLGGEAGGGANGNPRRRGPGAGTQKVRPPMTPRPLPRGPRRKRSCPCNECQRWLWLWRKLRRASLRQRDRARRKGEVKR